MAEENTVSALEKLTETIKLQNDKIKQTDDINQLETAISALEKSNSDNSAQLRETFNQIVSILENPRSNPEQIETAKDQLNAIKDLTGTEEENREAAKRQEESNELLSKMVAGIEGLADSYDKMLDNIKPSGGLLAGLGAAALLFMDPETLFKGVKFVLDGIFAIVDSIKMFLEGDFSGGFQLLSDNIGAVATVIGTLAVLFGGRIIRLFSSIVKGVQGVIRAVTSVGKFVMNLAGRFGGLAKIFGRIFLPFTIITGAIAAITGFIDGFKEGGILGGIEGGIKSLFDSLVAWPLDLLKDGVAWILGKLGFSEAETALNSFSFSTLIDDLIGGIFGMIRGAVDWIGTLFTDPVTALQNLWNGIVGSGGLLDIIFKPIDSAIAWIQGLFGWGDPDLPFDLRGFISMKTQAAIDWVKGLFTWASEGLAQGWTNLTDFVSSAWTSVKTWISDKLAWASEGLSQGWTNLTDYVKGKWTATKEWFTGLLAWAAEGLSDGWTNLTDFVKGKWQSVKTWFTGLFTWASEGLSEGWTNLTDFVKGKWTATKEWFTGLFAWSSDNSEGNFLTNLVNQAIEKVKTFFTDLFDFLPSFDEIKQSLTNMLPSWMRPDTVEEQRASLQAEITSEQARIDRSNSGVNEYYGSEESGREGSLEKIRELQQQLADLPQANRGGFVNAPESGTPVMLHGQEIITPLDSPQGKVLTAINQLMNAKAAAGAGEYSGMGGPMIIQGGSSSSSRNTNNISTSSYTIQQGITPDDFLKRDFINFSY